jgi:ubiquinone/menaquinone biosynthesis C-methylase UbiE
MLLWRRGLLAAFAGVVLLAGCTAFKRCAYEGFGRDEWQKPGQVIEALALKAGERVADLGSGGGYFTFRFARAVGPEGKVYAVDVDRDMLEYVAGRAKDEGLRNIEMVSAKYDDPLLPGTVGLIFACDVYHHIQDRAKYFANAGKYLAAGGRIVVIDFHEKGFANMIGHSTPGDLVRKEMDEAGYRLEKQFDFLEKQNFFVFVKKDR